MHHSPDLSAHALRARIAGAVVARNVAADNCLWMRSDRPSQAAGAPVVFIVNDDLSEREELETAIHGAGWRAEAFGSEDAFPPRTKDLAARCLVLDVSMPEQGDFLPQRQADMPVICIAAQGDVPTTVRAMKAGAVNVLAKPVLPEALLDAVRHALDLSTEARQQAVATRQLQDRHASLSQRERQVMALVVSGLLNKQVGGELGISEITVKAHRGRVMRKMEARSLAQLVKMAASLQLT